MAGAGSPEEPSRGVPCFVSGGRATCPSPKAALLAVSRTGADVTREVKLFYSTGYQHLPTLTVFC